MADGFAGGENQLINKTRTGNGPKEKLNSNDKFAAQQRVRLQLDAVASESLSGTVFFEIGNQVWGSNRAGVGGGALGADGANTIKLKRAYIDWMVPQTDLKFRMGIQGVTLPNKAGGSAIMDTDAAGITASYQSTRMSASPPCGRVPPMTTISAIRGAATSTTIRTSWTTWTCSP